MKPVAVESPYAGDVDRNVRYARLAMLDCLKRGEAPFLSHLLYTQVWDDMDPALRKRGIEAGQDVALKLGHVAAYIDLGISNGMALSIGRYYDQGVAVERRRLFTPNLANMIQLGIVTLDEALEREPQ